MEPSYSRTIEIMERYSRADDEEVQGAAAEIPSWFLCRHKSSLLANKV